MECGRSVGLRWVWERFVSKDAFLWHFCLSWGHILSFKLVGGWGLRPPNICSFEEGWEQIAPPLRKTPNVLTQMCFFSLVNPNSRCYLTLRHELMFELWSDWFWFSDLVKLIHKAKESLGCTTGHSFWKSDHKWDILMVKKREMSFLFNKESAFLYLKK